MYADFYGYSTIAVGAAKMLGIKIMDNFKTPYLSKSISEFWTRWHISLSTWFRDYLYISLGGNRVSLPRWTFNIMIVFMVSGLWHGASWTFVVWGALHGLMLLLERYFSKWFGFEIKEGWSFVNIMLCIKTFLVSSFIWIFFRAENFTKAREIINALIHWRGQIVFAEDLVKPFLFAAILLLFDVFLYNNRFDLKTYQIKAPLRWSIYAFLIFALMALSGTQKYAFIYFQF